MFAAFADAYGGLTPYGARQGAVRWLSTWDGLDDWIAAAPGEAGHTNAEEYLRAMSRSGEWGDHLALRALAERYKVSVAVLKLENRQYTWSKTGNFSQEIRLFLRDNHYELLYGNLVMI
jgi:hypothetical protein